MKETLLSPSEEDAIVFATIVTAQADHLPDYLVERHLGILDFYLTACPVQTHAIIELLANLREGDFDD